MRTGDGGVEHPHDAGGDGRDGVPAGAGLGSEKVLEASYLWQITANASLLPDLQLILDPALNPAEDRVWVAGLRLRITL